MQIQTRLLFMTFLLMISFASVNAVLFTPALPAIALYFGISNHVAQLTITWFLIGYALGQLLYGPIANRFGRKPALYAGILLQIISSMLCIIAGMANIYFILLVGRFLMALGSGVGLKMTFTLINELYEPKVASQKLSYLMIAFAIAPGLGIALGGILATHFSWISTFYASGIYGAILLLLVIRLPETKQILDREALKVRHLFQQYLLQFNNKQLIAGGLLMGCATCFVYIFAALAPFIAMNILKMKAIDYGMANLLPPIGLICGSLISAQLIKKLSSFSIIFFGIVSGLAGSVMMLLFAWSSLPALLVLFVPMFCCYFGLSLIFTHASILALSEVSDKAHGSSVMNFLNMGLATLMVIGLSEINIKVFMLASIYIFICVTMFPLFQLMKR